LQLLFEPLQACSVFGDSPHVFLEDDLLRGCGTDDFGEPTQMGRAAGSSAGIPDIAPQQKGFETNLRRLRLRMASSRARLRSRMASSSTEGIEMGVENAGAHQAGQLYNVAAVGFAAVARLFGEERRGVTTQQIWPFLVR
jgi:hypothetical protein